VQRVPAAIAGIVGVAVPGLLAAVFS